MSIVFRAQAVPNMSPVCHHSVFWVIYEVYIYHEAFKMIYIKGTMFMLCLILLVSRIVDS